MEKGEEMNQTFFKSSAGLSEFENLKLTQICGSILIFQKKTFLLHAILVAKNIK